MKNFLAGLAFLVVGFIVVGWYLNWFAVKVTPTNDGRHHLNVNFNTPKFTEDVKAGKEKLVKILDNAKDKKDKNNGSQTAQKNDNFPSLTNPVVPDPPNHQTHRPAPFQPTDDGFFTLPNDDPFVPPPLPPNAPGSIIPLPPPLP